MASMSKGFGSFDAGTSLPPCLLERWGVVQCQYLTDSSLYVCKLRQENPRQNVRSTASYECSYTCMSRSICWYSGTEGDTCTYIDGRITHYSVGSFPIPK